MIFVFSIREYYSSNNSSRSGQGLTSISGSYKLPLLCTITVLAESWYKISPETVAVLTRLGSVTLQHQIKNKMK
jgi:hypothetical protein